jgi:group I intron endonuclease
MADHALVVYAIRRKQDGRVYIGCTASGFKHRIGQHKSALNSSKHVNRHLQGAWLEEGEGGFEFSILEEVADPTCLLEREQYYLDKHFANGARTVFNVCRHAESRIGVIASEETCRKIGIAKRGNKNRLGKPFTEASKKKISESLKGRRLSKETRAKLSEAQKRVIHTQEWHAKIGAANKGKIIPQEMRDRISGKMKGRKLSDAERARRSALRLAREAQASSPHTTAFGA